MLLVYSITQDRVKIALLCSLLVSLGILPNDQHVICYLYTGPQPTPLSDPPQYEDLMEEVAAALPKKWMEVATKLGLPQTEIDRIEDIHNGTPNRYYRQVFNYWEKNKPKSYCWATVIEVLRSKLVEELGLASSIESRIR